MTFPPVFDGVGAIFVRTDNDPVVQLQRIKPLPTWVAIKVNGGDIQTQPEIRAWMDKLHGAYPTVTLGVWVYCFGPPANDVRSWSLFWPAASFVIYDVEAEYKTDEGAPSSWPADLVAAHPPTIPAAVTSYGAIPGYGNQPSSIDFRPFVDAGWAIYAQGYPPFTPEQAMTYWTHSGAKFPGPYPIEGIHHLVRSLSLSPGQSVYRPEGIDG